MGLWYDWEMQGRGLKDSQLGPSGINLLRDIGGCGATVTTWKFIWTPENGIYDWRASGGVDILKDECLGAALLAVGGNDRGRCSGTKANVLWPTDFS
jgi:hypothetical protein